MCNPFRFFFVRHRSTASATGGSYAKIPGVQLDGFVFLQRPVTIVLRGVRLLVLWPIMIQEMNVVRGRVR